jgi:hypothetical protein
VKRICQGLGIKKLRTTAYHPQANGLCEKAHDAVVQDIAKRCSIDQKDWTSYLADAVWSHNVQIHAATGYSPYFLMTGSDPRVGVDTALGVEEQNGFGNLKEEAISRILRIQKANKELKTRQEEQFNRMKRYYDADRKEASFATGQEVMIWNPKIRVRPGTAKKLCAKYEGPYRIIGFAGIGGSLALVRSLANPRKKCDPVSIQRLRAFKSRPEDKAVEMEEDEFEIDAIEEERESRTIPGTKEYFVLKTGHDRRSNIWIHEKDIEAPDLLEAWKRRNRPSEGAEEKERTETTEKREKEEKKGKKKETKIMQKKLEKNVTTSKGRPVKKRAILNLLAKICSRER